VKRLARLVLWRPRYTLAAVVPLVVIAVVLAPNAPSRLSNSETELFSRGTQSFAGAELLKRLAGLKAFPDLEVIVPVHGRTNWLALAKVKRVASLLPFAFRSRDNRAEVRVGFMRSGTMDGSSIARLATELSSLPHVSVGGSALLHKQFIDQARSDLETAELVAFPLLLILALLAYRSVIAALLLVLCGGLAIWVILLGLQAVNTFYPLSVLSLNVTVGIGLGLSLDYSLLYVTRFREELVHRADSRQAASSSLLTAGRTASVSALTVAAAFASLLAFPIPFLKSISVSGAVASATACLMAITVLPAACAVLGERVNALSPRALRRYSQNIARPPGRGPWYRLASFVTTHPRPVATLATLLLLALCVPIGRARLIGFDAITHAESSSLQRFESQLRSQFSYPPLEDVLVIAHGDEHTVQRLLREVHKLPSIATVEPTRVLGDSWVLHVVVTSGTYSASAMRLVERIRALPYHLTVTGTTAELVDTVRSLRAHLPLAVVLLLLTTSALLAVATRSLILPLKAITMNTLSLVAAFGVLVFIFQDGRFERFLSYHSLGAIFFVQPFIVCAATFGILMDYSIFMLTRIKEAWDSGMSNSESIAHGLERTGRTITAAALLFCVAVGAGVTSRLIIVKEAGVGLAVAVAIDATIVRALLVPSLMTLLGSWNWWPGSASDKAMRISRHAQSQASSERARNTAQ
jgi:uncharacterized membrane protein YdfJ with MMPL/SSD domain